MMNHNELSVSECWDSKGCLASRLTASEGVAIAICSTLPMIAVLTGAWYLFYLYAAITIALTVASPSVGVGMWLYVLPFEAISVHSGASSPYLFLTPALVLGAALSVALGAMRGGQPRWVLIFLILSMVPVVLSSLGAGSVDILRPLLSIMFLNVVVALSWYALQCDPERAWIIPGSVVVSACMAAVYAVMIWDGGWQLSLTPGWGGGVRHLDSILSIALASLFALAIGGIFSRSQGLSGLGSSWRWVGIMVAFGLFVALGATVARGAMVALFGGVAVVLLGAFFKGLVLGKVRLVFVYVALFCVAVTPVFVWLDASVLRGHLVSRMMLALSEPTGDGRWGIWVSGIEALKANGGLLGVGVGGFREAASASAHGIYVAVLVELGVLGLAFWLLAMLYFFSRAVLIRNAGVWFFVVFLILSFVTKGGMTDKYFYGGLIVAAAISSILARVRPRWGYRYA